MAGMTFRLIAPVAALAALAGLPACSAPQLEQAGSDAKTAPAADGLAIETAEVEQVDGVPLGSVPGTITLPPEARVAVTAPFPGAAVRVYVIEGQSVARGQPLALVRAAEPVQISGELARARSAEGLAQARSKRLTQLAEEGIIAQARADEAAAEYEQARATRVEAARLAAFGGVGPDGTMTLSAPIAGRVAHVGVETGGGVDGMGAPFVIEADGAYQVELQLPERLAREVRPGMAVDIAIAGTDGEALPIGGRIIAVTPSIDPATRSVMARASIGDAPGVVAGRNVSVSIRGSRKGLSVPERAVTRIDGQDHVFVHEGEDWAARPVTVTAVSGGQAIIAEGLKPGETVAASNVAELKAQGAE
jgi:cobalt-zinc-cadmium efflux system membrane fusion protein